MVQGASFSGSTLSRGIRNYPKYTRDEIHRVMEEFSQEVLQYARDHAPWQDRTGEARSQLGVEVSGGFQSWSKNAASLTLYHGVDYGIWLEVRWSGRFAIIIPTIEVMGPKLMEKLERITEDIIYYA